MPEALPPREARRVAPSRLRWTVDAAQLGFETTDALTPLEGVHAQARAIEAMRVATQVQAAGYNVFCVGLTGATRMETVRDALAQIQPRGMPAPDRCYVMNFRQPEAPRLLELPRGTARRFQRDVDDLVDQLVKHLGLVFEEDRFATRVREITERHGRQERDVLNKLHDVARDAGFVVSQVEGEEGSTVDLLYRLLGHPFQLHELERHALDVRAGLVPQVSESPEENQALAQAFAEIDLPRITAAHEELAEMLRRAMVEARRLARSMHRQISALEREESLVVIEGAVQELASRYAGIPGVRAHLDELKTDILEHLALFKRGLRPGASAEGEGEGEEDSGGGGGPDAYVRYRANVVLDNSNRDPVPYVVESNPTARNMLGTIVSITDRFGRPGVDHRSIRPGSLLAADGGFLVLDAADILAEPDAWRQLKRVMLEQRLDLRDAVSERGQPAGLVLRPEPIPVTVKVIMVGDHEVYELMDSMDVDFKHVFKIRAEFDWLMRRDPENVRRLGMYVRRLARAEGLLPFNAEAVAVLAEHAARLAEHPDHVVSRLDLLADPVRQANLEARRERAKLVTRTHVEQALLAATRRASLAAERVHEAIHARRIIINTQGHAVGQLNGLAVVSTIEHSFGYPVRITTVVARGSGGIVNIEREVRLSGSLHDKGMFIVQGYLSHVYGRDFPLDFNASVAFEQLYGGIEGDSASAAEIFALLSALSGVPLDQGIAVTGSVNQVGEIQPVGGVNEKIEGFFDACAGIAGGVEEMPGNQGVIIPQVNVGDLMLRPDVVQAVARGRFHVWAIEAIDQGIELMMGLPAGSRGARGRFEPGSVHARVFATLRRYSSGHHSGSGEATAPQLRRGIAPPTRPPRRTRSARRKRS